MGGVGVMASSYQTDSPTSKLVGVLRTSCCNFVLFCHSAPEFLSIKPIVHHITCRSPSGLKALYSLRTWGLHVCTPGYFLTGLRRSESRSGPADDPHLAKLIATLGGQIVQDACGYVTLLKVIEAAFEMC
jgi:hypothetical protein